MPGNKRLAIKVNSKVRDIYGDQLCLFDHELPSDEVIEKNMLEQMDVGEDDQVGMMFWNGHDITPYLEFKVIK